MAELGNDSDTWHNWAGKVACMMGVEEVFTIGDLAGLAAASFGEGAQHLPDEHALVEALFPQLT